TYGVDKGYRIFLEGWNWSQIRTHEKQLRTYEQLIPKVGNTAVFDAGCQQLGLTAEEKRLMRFLAERNDLPNDLRRLTERAHFELARDSRLLRKKHSSLGAQMAAVEVCCHDNNRVFSFMRPSPGNPIIAVVNEGEGDWKKYWIHSIGGVGAARYLE